MTIETVGPGRIDTGPFAPPHTLTGRFHLLRDFRSAVLGNVRDIVIYLPPGYEAPGDHAESGEPGDGEAGSSEPESSELGSLGHSAWGRSPRRYPVLYMHDGQNLFDEVTAFAGHEWRLDETAEALIAARVIAPLIIVGINHAGVDRGVELTPTADPRRKTGGQGARYAQFVVDEVKAYVDAHYRTLPDRDHTGTGGASLGGLIALYLGISAPDTFGRLLVMSPSLWWDRRNLLQNIRSEFDKLPLRIWLDAGTAEGGGTLQNTRMLKNALQRRGWTLGDDLRYLEAEGAWHTESAWAARAAAALEFLFPAG